MTLLLSIAGTAAAYYAYTDSSTAHPAQASADSLPQGATPATPAATPSPNSSTVSISFAQATTAAGIALPAASYQLQRYPNGGGAPVAVTSSCAGTGTITCTESKVPDGRWQYTDTPTAGQNWVGTESAKSPAVTVDTTAPTVAVAYPVSGTSYGANWTGTISGTAGDTTSSVSSTQVAIEDTTTNQWWNGTTFGAASASYQTATGTTSWTYGLAAAKLTSGHSYGIVARATDGVGNTATSPATAFTYNSSAPSAAVGYPVANVTYDGNWTGSISGTASSNAGSGTTLTGVGVAIEDTTTSQWWNGTSFSATSAAYQPTTGTTSWTYALSAAALTSGHGYAVTVQATDSIGNTGTSSTIPFSYNTTHPSVAVSYPTTNTTYGSNWTGAITGTASSNAGVGTSIVSAAVAVEDTTTSQWWNGTSFSATSQTFVTASGTSSWSYGLAASALTSGHSYSVIAEATDSAGNVGTSATTTFTYSTVSVSVLAQATGSGATATISNVTSISGATDLIAVYCYGGSACGSNGGTISVATGSGTPFASASAPTIESIVSSSNPKSCLELIQAVGNGTRGTVTVTVGNGYSIGFVNVLQLSSGATVKAVQVNPATQTTSSTATATLPTPVANSEIALLGITDGTGATKITPPSGMSLLGAYQQSSSVNGGSGLGMYFDPNAQASAAFGLSASSTWGTIALQVG